MEGWLWVIGLSPVGKYGHNLVPGSESCLVCLEIGVLERDIRALQMEMLSTCRDVLPAQVPGRAEAAGGTHSQAIQRRCRCCGKKTQRQVKKTNTIGLHSFVESKKTNSTKTNS